jgi:hypothetical protein
MTSSIRVDSLIGGMSRDLVGGFIYVLMWSSVGFCWLIGPSDELPMFNKHNISRCYGGSTPMLKIPLDSR